MMLMEIPPSHFRYSDSILLTAPHEQLVPQPGVKPMPPTVEVCCPNYCTAREVSLIQFLNAAYYSIL